MPLPRFAAWSTRLLGGLAFVWAGMVIGISFLEAPVKFTAPTLTLPVGLDVGRHVFAALNKVEVVLALASMVLVWQSRSRGRRLWIAAGVVWLALMAQTVWLLPALGVRAALIIEGGTPAGSAVPLHLFYGLAEGAKVVALLVVGGSALQAVSSLRGGGSLRARSAPEVRTTVSTLPHHPETSVSTP